MARKVDDLGRIVLPVETRRLFGIQAGDALEISVAEGAILLRKLETGCVFCDSRDSLREYRGKLVCGSCTGDIGGNHQRSDEGAPVGASAGVMGGGEVPGPSPSAGGP